MCLSLGNVIVGYSVCWSAPVIPKLLDAAQTPLTEVLTVEQASWLAAIFHLFVIIGSQTGAFLSNLVGRKPTLILFGAICLSSHIIRVLARDFNILLAGRIVNGLGVGGIASGNLVYIGEIASSDLRGIMLTVTGVLHTIGGLLVFSLGPYVSYAVVEYTAIALGVTHIGALFLIVETPVYHVIKGNEEAARSTLHFLGRSKDVDKELKTMIENVNRINVKYTQVNSKNMLSNCMLLDILRRRRNRRAMLITATLLTIQEGSGIACILSFATTIFRQAASSVDADVATIILGVTQVFGILLAPILVERYGRKSLLIFSTAACALWTDLALSPTF
ncbi:facilitated trehalose transporter Tret1-like isoform X2 [Leguminivora glycinivorella]|uniref:facilitated trehalose transporter Tret1-like isoform X2 n=1 Tax=Leguminivora glycinivorella TaxID=1035111 RepID=UPI0020105A4D|nr:facilitated trehalose transporter Tret1-like isoform X2 [Leguminivora glycinivorella]